MLPGDRRVLANSGPFELASGQVHIIDYAIIFARRSQDPHAENELEKLRNRADAIADKYCTEPASIAVGIHSDEIIENQLVLFPNPTTGKTKILFANNEPVVEINVFDMSGRKIKLYLNRNSNEAEVDLSNHPGMYLVKVQTIRGSRTFKLVVH